MAKNGGFGNEPDFDFNRVAGIGKKVGASFLHRLRWVGLGLVLLLAGLTTYYQVEPEEAGLVLRFGRYVRTTAPGPHFMLPFGIERVLKIPVERQLKEEFGFHTTRADVRSEYGRDENDERVSNMLTGDLNVAVVEWIVQYKIADPYLYAFRVRNVQATFRDMSEAAMRQVIGDHSVTEVLTVGRETIQSKARERLQELCDTYETGIRVLQLVLQNVDPPEPVRPSFNEVNQAIQERERSINEAWAEYSRVIPEAKGKAEQAIQSAEGYATERVNQARGQANRFLALQTEYQKSPQVTRSRLYLETLGAVLPKAGKRIVLDQDLKGLLPLLQLGSQEK
ncbi:MAG TPA: FtsH protease activity modulator HflK [Polyangiaceae bacterium]|jgi:membrane protease subunit HflK|nr:FtsH protease activity modulator HflK [Polyangiaceae bacterium]